MMKSEFIDLLIDMHEGENVIPNVSDDDYRIIETVYTYYPEFGDKLAAALLYDAYGIRIFTDMYPRAAQVRSCEARVEKIRRELEEALEELKEVKGSRNEIHYYDNGGRS